MKPDRKERDRRYREKKKAIDGAFHEIACPIYRVVIPGEKILAEDKRVWMDKLRPPDHDDINRVSSGEHLHLRVITTCSLQIQIK